MADQSLPLLLVVGGVVLMVMEALAPGAHFVVIGVALLVAGLLGLLFPPLATPIALAVSVLVVGGVALWVYRRFDIYKGTDEGRTEGSAGLRGKSGYVVERVTTRSGRVKLESGGGFSSRYAARTTSGEIEEGREIIVTDPGGGNVLTVEPAGPADGKDDIDRELERERRS